VNARLRSHFLDVAISLLSHKADLLVELRAEFDVGQSSVQSLLLHIRYSPS
jgi:hypothetical protein